jgi:hypothetical protein
MLDLGELPLDLGKYELREGATLLVNANIDSTILCNYCIGAQLVIFARDLAWELTVCRRSFVRARWERLGDVMYAQAMMSGWSRAMGCSVIEVRDRMRDQRRTCLGFGGSVGAQIC